MTLSDIANELCSCGGRGPNDPDVCDACRFYFVAKKLAQPTLDDLWPRCGVCGELASSCEAHVDDTWEFYCCKCTTCTRGDTIEEAAYLFAEEPMIGGNDDNP